MRVSLLILLSSLFCVEALAGVIRPKKALLISIGDYPADGRWKDLSAANDIRYIKQGLMYARFYPNDIRVLSDASATKANILSVLDSLIRVTRPGDIILVHYSGHAYLSKAPIKRTTYKSLTWLIPYTSCSLPDDPARDCWKELINTEELMPKFNQLRAKAGSQGQVVFTSDASYMGPDIIGNTGGEPSSANMRGGFFQDYLKSSNNTGSGLAPFIFMSACLGTQVNYETKDEENRGVGSFSYAFAKAMAITDTMSGATYRDLHRLVKSFITAKFPRQLPTIAGDEDQLLFTYSAKATVPGTTVIKSKQVAGDCYVISIGVNGYNMSRKFIQSNNSVSDASRMTTFIEQQFLQVKTDSARMMSYTLLDRGAKRADIYKALNNVINQSKPEDYFIFNFCGYSALYHDSTGRQEIYFAPFDVSDIVDSNAVKKAGITLANFKDLFELVPANNQLIITEAGSTEHFQQEFVKKLFETAPAMHMLTKRNRVIIVPNGYGYDETRCGNERIDAGPLNYCLTSLPASLNIFSLFTSGPEAEKVEYAVRKKEMECPAVAGRPYIRFFFEKQFMEELLYYMPDVLSQSRARILSKEQKTTLQRSIAEKHALVIGTNNYAGKPDWNNLNNPALDAKEVSDELGLNYGFKSRLLIDPTLDAVYDALQYYSRNLDSNDQFFLFIAGHGDYDSAFFDDGVLVFANSATYTADPFKKTYMKYAEFQKIINQFRARNIFVMLDVCFGGTFDARIAQQAFRTKGQDVYAALDNNSFLSEKLRFRSRIYMTSGGKNVVPDGYDKLHSPFAKQFLKALRDATERGVLTTSNIFTYVETLPSGPRKGTFGSDEPGSEFIFVAEKKEPAK
jgi:hypothetical protein